MDTLLVAINARYSHTNLAVRYLWQALKAAGIPAAFREYTINQPLREILSDLYAAQPQRVLFSCYLWNIAYVRQLGADLRLLRPDCQILLGGPEVSFDSEELLAQMPWADGILAGEGEALLPQVLSLPHPQGVYRAKGFVDLDKLPFPYPDLSELSHRILYYESSRGCPFGCAYCLSSADRVPRFRSLDLVFQDLQRFLDARVMQVKFVDRTFNLDARRAQAIWAFLKERDNGVTSFQMELGADLLTPEALELLRDVRPGLFQFEIGVQSTCPAALEVSCRKTDLQKLFQNVRALRQSGRIHQHLDLIAGLPAEGFSRFAQSFDEVFALRPQQLQLGFLKLLRGSNLYTRRQELGLVHSAQPPYEILRTPQLTFEELCRIKQVEEMTERYYNSGRFTHGLEDLLTAVSSPFFAFLALARSLPEGKPDQYACYDQLFQFAISQGVDAERLRWHFKYDLCLHERPRRLPRCLQDTQPGPQTRREIAALKLEGSVYAAWFPWDPRQAQPEGGPVLLHFDYQNRDLLGHAACRLIPTPPISDNREDLS